MSDQSGQQPHPAWQQQAPVDPIFPGASHHQAARMIEELRVIKQAVVFLAFLFGLTMMFAVFAAINSGP